MKPIDTAVKLLSKGYVCDHCLGRQFAQLLSGYSHQERGMAVRLILAMALEAGEELNVDEANFQDIAFWKRKVKKKKAAACKVCGNIFSELGRLVKRAEKELEGYEFSTLLVGVRLSKALIEKEEKLWDETGIEFCESIKNELSRELGKLLAEKTGKEVNREHPEVAVVFDLDKNRIELNVNSLYVYGKYKKLRRGMPQTKWPCSKCRGLGCEDCKWTGRQYKDTVEELVAGPALEAADGVSTKFHGAGREDIDALNLAGREFVLEVREPRKRSLDFRKLQGVINRNNRRKVQVSSLRMSSKREVVELKEKKALKTYRAVVELEKSVKKEDLKKVEKLDGAVISQRTPARVAHRRADMVRKRKVLSLKARLVRPKELEIEVRAEAGLYIKELISGDDGRTKPSVAGLLGVPAKVKYLDIIGIGE